MMVVPIDAQVCEAQHVGEKHWHDRRKRCDIGTVRVVLVKNGAIAATWTGTTPLSIVHQDTAEAARRVYRLDARASPADYLLTNPVFVAP